MPKRGRVIFDVFSVGDPLLQSGNAWPGELGRCSGYFARIQRLGYSNIQLVVPRDLVEIQWVSRSDFRGGRQESGHYVDPFKNFR